MSETRIGRRTLGPPLRTRRADASDPRRRAPGGDMARTGRLGKGGGENGVAVATVGALSSLVADIAAGGSRPRGGMLRSIRQDG